MTEKKCCKDKSLSSGLLYGLVPHAGCIAFILFSVLGATAGMAFLKPFMLNKYFFYILIGISLFFATLSAMFYLKRNSSLSVAGIKAEKKYLSVLYGSTVVINLVLVLFVFPLTANFATGAAVETGNSLTLKVDIPCPGHALLITDALRSIDGVVGVEFRFPDLFDVSFDSSLTSEKEILSLDVFKTYKASVIG
ncbi:hypothetical protein KY319_04525 [Candidatus Woesearchaeota archaeon]|nr:hypothetical protein [Candidatus Woesearchaeota archaeon]